MELEKKGNKCSISSWDGSKLHSNGKMKDNKLPKIMIILSIILSIGGFGLMGLTLFTMNKSHTVAGLITLFVATVLFFVGEIVSASQKANKDIKNVKGKFSKDDYFDN